MKNPAEARASIATRRKEGAVEEEATSWPSPNDRQRTSASCTSEGRCGTLQSRGGGNLRVPGETQLAPAPTRQSEIRLSSMREGERGQQIPSSGSADLTLGRGAGVDDGGGGRATHGQTGIDSVESRSESVGTCGALMTPLALVGAHERRLLSGCCSASSLATQSFQTANRWFLGYGSYVVTQSPAEREYIRVSARTASEARLGRLTCVRSLLTLQEWAKG